MLYVAFICSLLMTVFAGAIATRDFVKEPHKRFGIVFALIVITMPFIYLANEVLKRVF